MTLEAVLYILLGFLVAIFLVLMFAPVVWDRATTLTERKIRASLPIKREEIEAEKDKLRAEHAMVVRRFEIGIKDLREKLNVQTSNMHSKLRDNAVLSSKSAEDELRISSLENANTQLREKLLKRDTEVSELTRQLTNATGTPVGSWLRRVSAVLPNQPV